MPRIEKSDFIDLFNLMYTQIKNFVYYKTGDMQVAGFLFCINQSFRF